MQLKLRPGDWAALLLSGLVLAGLTWGAWARQDGALRVEVESPFGTFTYPLEQERRWFQAGALGDSQLEIKDGGVQFLDSPCSNKLCIAQGHQTASGDWAACLPNRLFVRVAGSPAPGGLDAQSY